MLMYCACNLVPPLTAQQSKNFLIFVRLKVVRVGGELGNENIMRELHMHCGTTPSRTQSRRGKTSIDIASTSFARFAHVLDISYVLPLCVACHARADGLIVYAEIPSLFFSMSHALMENSFES